MFWDAKRIEELKAFVFGDHSFLSSRRPKMAEFDSAKRDEVIEFISSTMGLSFSEALLKMIDMRGMTDPEVYKAANVDRRVFSKIRSNLDYQPSRSTAIRLCLALKMQLGEAMSLLEKAGFCLSRSKKADLVVTYCLDHEIFDLNAVNEALRLLGLEELC